MPRKLKNTFLYCVVVILSACGNRPDGVMTRREMQAFLIDLHLTEGVLMSESSLSENEKASYYQALFQKHGISKAEFDSSLVYYTKNPKMFERIYAKVTKHIENVKADVEAGKYLPEIPDSIRLKPAEVNIWQTVTSFTFPEDTLPLNLRFGLANDYLQTKDVYRFSFRMRTFPHDSVKSGYTVFRIHYAGGRTDTLFRQVLNDSVLRRYRFTFTAFRNFKIDSLSGVFFAGEHDADTVRTYVDSISLIRKYIPAIQDSLRLQLDTVFRFNLKPDTTLCSGEEFREYPGSLTEKIALRQTCANCW